MTMKDSDSDELMAVLMAGPPPEGDAEAAAYRAAERDMALLREELGLLGDLLAREEPGTAPPPVAVSPPPRPRWRRPGVLVLAASAALLAGAAGVGLLWTAARPADDGLAKLTEAGLVSCARVIADGTVTAVEPAGARLRVVLTADRFLKPDAPGTDRVEFLIPRNEAAGFPPGASMVVSVSRFEDEPVMGFTGGGRAEAWEWMAAALPESRSTPCEGRG
ncbi:hypothetical protein AB0C45_02325 [Streptomyces cyaneofuscatus]|uniref:hypothetical protein n=1 Tax=Streptomyces cyaneofuscatus TaxID=66883 RepID=UPI0033DD5CBB